MKKIIYSILLCGLSLLLLPSCEKENGKSQSGGKAEATMKGMFYAAVSDAEPIKILPGKTKNTQAQVCVFENKVSDVTLNISLKVAPEGLDVYNAAHPDAPALLLPSSGYEFVTNSMMLARFNKASTSARIKIKAEGLENDQLYVLPLTVDKVEGTNLWELAAQPYGFIKVLQTIEGPEGGDGSMEFPYELKTPEDLVAMKDKLSADEKVFFKMMNDIDMSSVDNWEPLNWGGKYEFAIDFDGQGHTIDHFHISGWGTYASFFGVLNGYCHDVNFTNALVECGADSGCGILGGYGGSGDKHADVARVDLHGKVHFTGNKTGIGGMFGCAGNATIEGCTSDVEVYSTKNYVGGLIGYSKNVQIRNCFVTGSVRGDQRVGGISGGLNGDGDAIYNSVCTARIYTALESIPADADGGLKVDQKEDDANIVLHWATESDGLKVGDAVFTDAGNTVPAADGDYTRSGNTVTVENHVVKELREYGVLRSVGGIVGHANQDKGDTPGTRTPGNVVSGCIVWMDAIKTRTWVGDASVLAPPKEANNFYSSGAIVGFGASHNTYENCYHNADLIFRDYASAFKFYEQQNSSPDVPLSYQEAGESTYNFPYHGKAAPAGATITQVAQSLNWDGAIWDFSGDVPSIKPNAPVGPIPDVAGEGTLPGFDENDLN